MQKYKHNKIEFLEKTNIWKGEKSRLTTGIWNQEKKMTDKKVIMDNKEDGACGKYSSICVLIKDNGKTRGK